VAGTYDRLHQRVIVSIDGDRLLVATEPSGVLRALGVRGAVLDATPTGLSEDGAVTAVAADPATGQREVVVFTAETPSQPSGLYLGGRLHRQIG